MTITDLKSYAERINAKANPTDKFSVVLNRTALSYIGAFLCHRKKSLEQSLSNPKTTPAKRKKREYELSMISEAITALEKTKQL